MDGSARAAEARETASESGHRNGRSSQKLEADQPANVAHFVRNLLAMG